MSEVAGLVLSMGEQTTKEAIKKLKAQTVPVKKIILIKNVSPWAKAFALGLSKVDTEFFINCNADMLLYPNCIEKLLGYIKKDVGLVIGKLQDPLYGTVLGIKLYRTNSVESLAPSPKSTTPDEDIAKRMIKKGWKKVYANNNNPLDGSRAETLGLHCPEYTPIYTYKKFKTLGIRIAKRGRLENLYLHWNPLKASAHPMTKVAIVALSLGLFCKCQKNMLELSDVKKEFNSIEGLLDKIRLSDNTKCNPIASSLLKENSSAELLFKQFFNIGRKLKSNLALSQFNIFLNGLLNSKNQYFCFGAIGLCYGFFHNLSSPNINKEWLRISHIK